MSNLEDGMKRKEKRSDIDVMHFLGLFAERACRKPAGIAIQT